MAHWSWYNQSNRFGLSLHLTSVGNCASVKTTSLLVATISSACHNSGTAACHLATHSNVKMNQSDCSCTSQHSVGEHPPLTHTLRHPLLVNLLHFHLPTLAATINHFKIHYLFRPFHLQFPHHLLPQFQPPPTLLPLSHNLLLKPTWLFTDLLVHLLQLPLHTHLPLPPLPHPPLILPLCLPLTLITVAAVLSLAHLLNKIQHCYNSNNNNSR